MSKKCTHPSRYRRHYTDKLSPNVKVYQCIKCGKTIPYEDVVKFIKKEDK